MARNTPDADSNMAITRSKAKINMVASEAVVSTLFDKSKAVAQIQSLKNIELPTFLKTKQSDRRKEDKKSAEGLTPSERKQSKSNTIIKKVLNEKDKISLKLKSKFRVDSSSDTNISGSGSDWDSFLSPGYKATLEANEQTNGGLEPMSRSQENSSSSSGPSISSLFSRKTISESSHSNSLGQKPESRCSSSTQESMSSECITDLENRILSTAEIDKALYAFQSTPKQQVFPSQQEPNWGNVDIRLKEMNFMLKSMFESSKLLQAKIDNLEKKYSEKPHYIKVLPKIEATSSTESLGSETSSHNELQTEPRPITTHLKKLYNTRNNNKEKSRANKTSSPRTNFQNTGEMEVLSRILKDLYLSRSLGDYKVKQIKSDSSIAVTDSVEFCQKLYAPVDKIPEISLLKQALVGELPAKIPIRKFIVNELLKKSKLGSNVLSVNFDKIFTIVSEEQYSLDSSESKLKEKSLNPATNSNDCNNVSLRFEAALTTASIGNLEGTEAFLQYTLDTILHAVFGTATTFASLPLRYDRNKIDTSLTKSGKRPDFLCWYNDLLVFKGEEKKCGNVRNIALELTDKMQPNKIGKLKGQIPFLLCYATAGSNILFVAINQANQMLECSQVLDMNSIADRVTILLILVNTMRIAQKIAQKVQA
ncbi:hypothetical protein BB561_004693 [Smittium simulii]|uniref:Uncharacterized protein n=1 Tax=Smittium simulii TaxID=133385 RepID=A0A2T9YER4_9FUNG|nr:hypothetical protein BB561_004693 [Smittium simulii]